MEIAEQISEKKKEIFLSLILIFIFVPFVLYSSFVVKRKLTIVSLTL